MIRGDFEDIRIGRNTSIQDVGAGRDEQIFEFACHEANYSMIHILEAGRERDRQR